MEQKEFINRLSLKVGLPTEETSQLIASLVADITGGLQEDKSVNVANFGTFEAKKRAERISVSPTTGQRLLVPPKLAIAFRPSPTLKEKFK
ncbi:MAG: HU family DNA-binding protein [Prevotellaceae bacterium]|jgi:DNA-binding protein HU-beta|nr:HU family DNA-binding protein [Prevotellaceae bacterium]